MSMETMCEFLGWCTVINLGFFIFVTVKILAIRDWASKINAKMFAKAHSDGVIAAP